MTKLIIIRHCQAEGNQKRFFQGRIDSDITALGRKQIGQVSETLCAEPIDVFYTTSYIRARKTAEGINVYHECEIRTDDDLAEIDPGDWEGMYLTEIEEKYPQEYDNWKNHPAVFQAPNGESMSDVYERVKKALTRIVNDNPEKTVCIVSHGCAIRNMMCFAHGRSVSGIDTVPLGTNTSINVVKFENDMTPHIIMDNYTDHLGTV